jgi:S-disulfanyl-L-cysteine oxidoreductase SoxD
VNPGLRVVPLAALGLIAAGALWAEAASHSVWEGVYSTAQAQRGATLYTSVCTECHQQDLAGNGADVPPLAGTAFMNDWDGLAVAALVDRIHTTMPQSNPGSLSVQQATDLTAFLLSSNHIPAGSNELPADPQAQQNIQFQAKRPSP